jgi:hypothetical protein
MPTRTEIEDIPFVSVHGVGIQININKEYTA